MASVDFSINRNLTCYIREIGKERTPVIVCDEVLDNVAAVCDLARDQVQFQAESNTAYPGVRARLPASYISTLTPLIHQLIVSNYSLAQGLKLTIPAGFFSLVATTPEGLSAEQKIPHFDSPKPEYFAVMQYLNQGEFGGTSFYRHRNTGFENIYAHRQQLYFEDLRQQQPHLERMGYIVDSDTYFERIDSVEYRRNRLLIYPSSLLHSGDIRSNQDISVDPAVGRLTANLFVDYC